MNSGLNVYVLTYKLPSFNVIEDENHIQLQVGAFGSKEYFCDLHDDILDNISEKNFLYSELTGLYWIWKNRELSKYIGCEHYRRHFDLTEEEVSKILEKYSIILPKKYLLNALSVEDFHKKMHNINDLNMCRDIIYEIFPEYKDSYEKYIVNSRVLYIANSFISSREVFEDMCNFIFTIFFEFEKRMGYRNYTDWAEYVKKSNIRICPHDHKNNGLTWEDYQLRIFGFLSERLITLYVRHHFENKIFETDLIRLDKQKKDMKTLLCCIGRLENAYIREYVEYYKELGVTNICLFDNNYDGEEDFNDVIGDYINDGFVILKNYRNRQTCQLDAYNECYETYGKQYDWIMFYDIDEFMFINVNKNISDFLSRSEFVEFDMIHINWLLYGDNGYIKNDGRKIFDRLNKPLDINQKTTYDFPDNFHCKSIIRGGLPLVKWDKFSHTPTNFIKCCNTYGLPCKSSSPFVPYDFRNAGLKHFTTKTAEEYAIKILKGFPDNNKISKENMVKIFFKRNEVTEEKVEIFKRINGIDMSYLLPIKFDGEKRKDVQIFSLCYAKKDFKFLDNEVVTPLQVGAANGTNVCYLKDNMGDNISYGNFFYIENTGTYWIWKNVTDAKYKGQMQYRRPLNGINEETDFENIFSKYDVITCEPFHHPSHKIPTKEEPMVIPADTVEQGYAFSNCIDDLYIMEMVIQMLYPDYVESYYKYIKQGPNLYYSNGFIMKSEDYDRYCEFLFTCLNAYLHLANISSEEDLINHVKYNMEVGKYIRYNDINNIHPDAIKWQCSIGGFLSERLWTLWLQHNFKDERILKLPYIKMEENMYT